MNPSELRYADPDSAETTGQREVIIAILNLADEVRRVGKQIERIADHFDPDGRR